MEKLKFLFYLTSFQFFLLMLYIFLKCIMLFLFIVENTFGHHLMLSFKLHKWSTAGRLRSEIILKILLVNKADVRVAGPCSITRIT